MNKFAWEKILSVISIAFLVTEISSFQQQFSHAYFDRGLVGPSRMSNLLADISPDASEAAEFDWDEIARDVFMKDKRPVILFDGVCNLCNGGVNFALDNDSIGSFRFASLQSTIGKALLVRSDKRPDDISSIVLVTEEKAYFKSDAVLRIASKLDGNILLPIAGTAGRIVPTFIRNTVYDFVAENRYRFGESDQCRLDFGEFDDRFVEEP